MTVPHRQQILLWGAGVVGVAAGLPYAFTLQWAQIEKATATGASLPVIVAASLVQTALLLALAVFLGAHAMRALGLRAPVSETIAARQPTWPVVRRFALRALLVGLASGGAILALDALVFSPLLPTLSLTSGANPPIWMGLLASLYGGIVEELLLRFLLLGLLAWGLRAIARAKGLPAWAFWTANVLSAIIFGLGHLPATAAIVPLTALVVTRALVLNGIGGLAFGWLYRRDGLEAGMLAHGTADVVLHVVAPLL